MNDEAWDSAFGEVAPEASLNVEVVTNSVAVGHIALGTYGGILNLIVGMWRRLYACNAYFDHKVQPHYPRQLIPLARCNLSNQKKMPPMLRAQDNRLAHARCRWDFPLHHPRCAGKYVDWNAYYSQVQQWLSNIVTSKDWFQQVKEALTPTVVLARFLPSKRFAKMEGCSVAKVVKNPRTMREQVFSSVQEMKQKGYSSSNCWMWGELRCQVVYGSFVDKDFISDCVQKNDLLPLAERCAVLMIINDGQVKPANYHCANVTNFNSFSFYQVISREIGKKKTGLRAYEDFKLLATTPKTNVLQRTYDDDDDDDDNGLSKSFLFPENTNNPGLPQAECKKETATQDESHQRKQHLVIELWTPSKLSWKLQDSTYFTKPEVFSVLEAKMLEESGVDLTKLPKISSQDPQLVFHAIYNSPLVYAQSRCETNLQGTGPRENHLNSVDHQQQQYRVPELECKYFRVVRIQKDRFMGYEYLFVEDLPSTTKKKQIKIPRGFTKNYEIATAEFV